MAAGEKVTCPLCGRMVAVSSTGKLWGHRRPQDPFGNCRGGTRTMPELLAQLTHRRLLADEAAAALPSAMAGQAMGLLIASSELVRHPAKPTWINGERVVWWVVEPPSRHQHRAGALGQGAIECLDCGTVLDEGWAGQ